MGQVGKALDHRRVAVEQAFYNENISFSMTIGYIISAVMCAAAAHSVRVVEVTLQQVKSASDLSGQADKKDVQRIVHLMFQLKDKLMSNHVADASMWAIARLLTKKVFIVDIFPTLLV